MYIHCILLIYIYITLCKYITLDEYIYIYIFICIYSSLDPYLPPWDSTVGTCFKMIKMPLTHEELYGLRNKVFSRNSPSAFTSGWVMTPNFVQSQYTTVWMSSVETCQGGVTSSLRSFTQSFTRQRWDNMGCAGYLGKFITPSLQLGCQQPVGRIHLGHRLQVSDMKHLVILLHVIFHQPHVVAKVR